jgi:hypothetical protein
MPYKDKEAQREYQRAWMRKRREEFFNNKVCVNCESSENLELDHIDPDIKIDHKIWSWSKARREEELTKCQVLCYICHLDKSRNEKSRGSEVGSSKLTELDILEIRRLHSQTYNYREIADIYKVDESNIGYIIRGKTWKHAV